jgi:hypothetical protein
VDPLIRDLITQLSSGMIMMRLSRTTPRVQQEAMDMSHTVELYELDLLVRNPMYRAPPLEWSQFMGRKRLALVPQLSLKVHLLPEQHFNVARVSKLLQQMEEVWEERSH